MRRARLGSGKWDSEFAAGLGGRITASLGETLSWGIVAQALWWEDHDSRASLYDLQAGAGPSFQLGKVLLYGGPMLHFVRSNTDLEEVSRLGGYVGGGYELAPSWTVSGEVQWTPDAHGLSVALQRRF